MEIITSYPQHPGCCRFCMAARPGPVLDTLLMYSDAQYDGRLYICSVCIEDFYSTLTGWQAGNGGPGLVPAEQLFHVRAERDQLQEQVAGLTVALQDAIPTLLAAVVPLQRPPATAPNEPMPVPEQPAAPQKPERQAARKGKAA